jgi:1-aminocyclopropane-1-carboxylate deaminase/D-cysteine desulfhydrase-like pyridoxal-dependent ACC family enzyme
LSESAARDTLTLGMSAALFAAWPKLRDRLDAVSLGDFPTPVERLHPLESVLDSGPLYVKRDDLSSGIYGGNKVRTLEILFGQARARGADEVLATGAYGSNHAVATVLHAARAGLRAGAILFPQPGSWAALENARVSAARARPLHDLRHWSQVPFAMWRAQRPNRLVMPPGGASASGALGYVAAALELAQQVSQWHSPPPGRVVVGVGSTCTTAGLLLGFACASHLGIWPGEPPVVVAVRVSPWPVTSRFRILQLAKSAAARLSELTGDTSLRFSRGLLGQRLLVEGRELGPGYARETDAGRAVSALFAQKCGLVLDSTYSAKAAAGFLRGVAPKTDQPALFWSTKSSAPLPRISADELCSAPPRLLRRIERWRVELRDAGRLPEQCGFEAL